MSMDTCMDMRVFGVAVPSASHIDLTLARCGVCHACWRVSCTHVGVCHARMLAYALACVHAHVLRMQVRASKHVQRRGASTTR